MISRELDKLEQSLMRTQAAIDKKQNAVDVKLKSKAHVRKSHSFILVREFLTMSCHFFVLRRHQLEEGRERGELCPLEADLARVKDEIKATVNYCNEAKAK